MIKILLTSDIHFGIDTDDSICNYKDRVATFQKIVSLAKDHDLLLIAGDLFNSTNINKDTIEAFKDYFKSLKESNTEVIITPGYNEIYDYKKNVIKLTCPDQVVNESHLHNPYKYSKDNQEVYVYGAPPLNLEDYQLVNKSLQDGFHIGLFYTKESGFFENIYDQFSNNPELLKKNLPLDFYALGGNHSFKLFKSNNKVIGAYSGTPEATGKDETGDRYVISFSVKNNKIKQIKRLTVNTLHYICETLDCSNFNDQSEIIEKLKSNMSNTTAYTLNLTGTRNFILEKNFHESYSSKYRFLEIINQSSPSIEALINEFSNENSFRNEFFTILKEKLSNKDIYNKISIENLTTVLNLITTNDQLTEETLCTLLNA